MFCLGTYDEEVRNKAVISFWDLEQPTVMSLASRGWSATPFYFTFFESYKSLEQCLCLIRVPRCHYVWDFKGLKKRKARRGRIKSPQKASVEVLGPLPFWAVLCQTDDRTYRCLPSHQPELLFSWCMLLLPRNGLFINDLTLLRHLGLFLYAK